MAAALIAVLAGVVAVVALRGGPGGDPGRLSEPSIALPAEIALPELSDATVHWGLADVGISPAADMMAGGVAVADVDGDLDVDLIVANGDVAVLRWSAQANRFDPPQYLDVNNAIGVTATDVDRDGHADLLVATANDTDLVFWGGSGAFSGAPAAALTELAASGPSSGLLAGELTGDGVIDIVRLGRGTPAGPEPDILWVGDSGDGRSFTPQQLPIPDRFTLAGELVDADGDGLLDIWLTRDVGWAHGADSLLSRQGDAGGTWTDVADELGLALKVDGMGITVADLDGDEVLDAYVSDLGDNEVLMGVAGGGFRSTWDTGAAHIRPLGADDDVVSSTWGTGAIDINLDGVLDLAIASGGFPTGSISNKIDGTQVAVSEPPAVLLGIGDGTFVDVWPQVGLDLDLVARGMAVADFDGDGDDDVVIADREGTIHAVRNDTSGPSVIVSVDPECPHVAGLTVTITHAAGSYQRLLAPHGYASSHGAEVIVGTPAAAEAEVRWAGPGWVSDGIAVDQPAEQRIRVPATCADLG